MPRTGEADPQRILIVNPFGIGDVLFSTPLVHAVRRAFPQCHLTYLCNRRVEPILSGNPYINELFVHERDDLVGLFRSSQWQGLKYLRSFLQRVRRARFDILIDLSLNERYAFILKLIGVRRRIGFNYHNRGRFLTQRLPIDGYQDAHVVEYYRELLAFMGIRLVEASLELHVSEDDRRWVQQWLAARGLEGSRTLVGIVPAGGVSWGIDAPFRRWSSEGFAAVADALAERHQAQIILFGEGSDRSICERVAKRMKHQAVDASGQTTLGQFVGLLERLNLVICNDGGPLHLAVSRGVRTVSIFGPVDPRVYGPYSSDTGRHRVVCRSGLPCRPCYHQFRLPPCPYERACLREVDPESVLSACDDALSHQGDPACVS